MANIKFILFFVLICLQSIAQNISIKVIDSKTALPLPYASIKLNNTIDLIANDEGIFNLSESQNTDTTLLIISYLGYQSQNITVADIKQQNLIVKLSEVTYNLNEVSVNNVKPDPNALMLEVKNHLKENYTTDGNPNKKSVFLREGTFFTPSQINIDINKSTGFSKKQLKEVEKEVSVFCSHLMSNPSKKYEDLLCDLYTTASPKNNSKINVLKATVIKGEGSATSIDDLEKKGLSILLKHLDSTKYYRVKSGLIGSRDTISFKNNTKKEKEKNSNLVNTKSKINTFFYQQKPLQGSKFDFIYNPELYEYSYNGKVYDDKTNELVYILNFSPKKNKAKYTGNLYISESDYAVLKCNYKLAKDKIVKGINLKLLFGIKVQENINNGTFLFKKATDKNIYELQYAFEEEGQYFYLNRPLKFIELTKGEKDVFAFDLKIEGNLINKTELLTITKSEINQPTFDKIEEKEFNFTNLKRYDPKIWSNYISIEPIEAMKQYKAL